MYFKINGTEFNGTGNETWLDCLNTEPKLREGALGISIQGRTAGLDEKVEEYAYAHILTFADEEGRRIYERTISMLFLAAANELYPKVGVRFEHSYGKGVFISLHGEEIPEDFAAGVERRMRELVAADAPITRRKLSMEEAKRYFERIGQHERLRILKYRKVPFYTLYELDGYEDYFYGHMTPSAGFVPYFSIVKTKTGLVLMQPDEKVPTVPAAFTPLPKLQEVYEEAERWCGILGCSNAADLNEMVDSHRLREFIRVSEALLEKKYQEVAEQFIASGARVLLIAGPSSSGKTTTSHRLKIALQVHGLRPVKLSLDDYYINRADIPLEPDGSLDLEKLETLDIKLLGEHLPRLLNGETVEMPEFDFKTGTRMKRTHPLRVEPGQPIIIEGIHALNDALTATVPRNMKFKVYISALTMLNLDEHNRIRSTDARLLRRIVRDKLFRGTPAEATMAMWDSVRHGENCYIFPYQEQADAVLNTSMPYELVIMKKYAYPSLIAVQPESPYYTLAGRLVKFLNFIQTAEVEDEIPVNSILREFIGGCCFYREED